MSRWVKMTKWWYIVEGGTYTVACDVVDADTEDEARAAFEQHIHEDIAWSPVSRCCDRGGFRVSETSWVERTEPKGDVETHRMELMFPGQVWKGEQA